MSLHKLNIYQVDAFTDQLFGGNPAAIVPLQQWLPDHLMQEIAAENNLAETAFYVKRGNDYDIRWFTPTIEVALCGHATLASAYVVFEIENRPGEMITFHSKSGPLIVKKKEGLLELDFPADHVLAVEITNEIIQAIGITPIRAYKGKSDLMLVFENQKQIESLRPDLNLLAKIPVRGVIATATGYSVDFVSRFFAPQSGINEDPVTGSAHTTLVPYWAKVLNKTKMKAIQVSARRGYLDCELVGDRVKMAGKAVLYLEGVIYCP